MPRLHHVNIRIKDAEASLRFYRCVGLEHVGTAALAPGYSLRQPRLADSGLALDQHDRRLT